MEQVLDSIASALIWGVAFAASIGGLFALGELVVKKEHKQRISLWLNGVSPGDPSIAWPAAFVHMFDQVFGSKMLSLRFAGTSAGISLVVACMLLLAWGVSHPEQISTLFGQHYYRASFLVLLTLIVANVVPDYLSNCQSRYIMGRLASSNKTVRAYISWLTLDLVVTVVVAMSITVPLMVLGHEVARASMPYGFKLIEQDDLGSMVRTMLSLEATWLEVRHALVMGTQTSGVLTNIAPPYGVYFYTTFLTSSWVLLYAISGLAARFVMAAFGVRKWVFGWLDTDKRPVASLGAVSAIIVIAVAMCWGTAAAISAGSGTEDEVDLEVTDQGPSQFGTALGLPEYCQSREAAMGRSVVVGDSDQDRSRRAREKAIEIEGRMKQLIAEQLGLQPDTVEIGSRFVDDLGADETESVELVMAVQEEWETEIPDIYVNELETIGELLEYVAWAKLEAAETVEGRPGMGETFLMPVEDVFVIQGLGDVVATGEVLSGA